MLTVEEAIRTKRAVRQFTDQPLSEEVVRAILNAGRRSQSSKNSQPWSFVVVRDRATLKRLSECGTYAGHLAGAAMGVVLVAKAEPPAPDAAERQGWIMFDLGQAAAYMQLAAWELGVGSCIATIYEPEKARVILGVPAEMACDVALSLGYPAEQRPSQGRGRVPLEQIVHEERW